MSQQIPMGGWLWCLIKVTRIFFLVTVCQRKVWITKPPSTTVNFLDSGKKHHWHLFKKFWRKQIQILFLSGSFSPLHSSFYLQQNTHPNKFQECPYLTLCLFRSTLMYIRVPLIPYQNALPTMCTFLKWKMNKSLLIQKGYFMHLFPKFMQDAIRLSKMAERQG